MAQKHLVGQGLLINETSLSHWDTPHSAGLLWNFVPAARFEPTIPPRERQQTHALHHVITGIGYVYISVCVQWSNDG